MRHAAPADVVFFEVHSGRLVPSEPSAPTASGAPLDRGDGPMVMRVQSRTELSRKTLPVEVASVEADGIKIRFASEGTQPAVVSIPRPPSQTVSLVMTLPRPARLVLGASPSPPARPTLPAPPAPWSPTANRQPTRLGAHYLDLIPEGGDLVAGLDNRLFVRLLDADQRPLANTRLAVLHPRLPGRRLELRTDVRGLAELRINADRPTLEVRVELQSAKAAVTHPVQLVAVGRELILSAEPHVLSGAETRVRIQTLRLRGTLSCELILGETWVWAHDVALDGRPQLTLEVPIPTAPDGTRFDLQCALSTTSPGLAWASRPLVVASPTTGLEPHLIATQTARPWLAERLVLSTREADLTLAIASWEAARRLVLVALLSVIVSLFLTGALVLMLHIRRTRRRIAEALHDEPVDIATLKTIQRTRGLFFLAIATALAIGWIASVGALLS